MPNLRSTFWYARWSRCFLKVPTCTFRWRAVKWLLSPLYSIPCTWTVGELGSKFLQDGFFDSTIGDLLPAVVSNVLHLNIIIFQRFTPPPVMFGSPLEVNNSIGTIFLVYHPSHQGHYNAALKCVEEQKFSESGSTKKVFCCSCGINISIEGRKSCKSQPLYASRCKCYKNSVSCSLACRCKKCANEIDHHQMSENEREDITLCSNQTHQLRRNLHNIEMKPWHPLFGQILRPLYWV